VIYLLEVFGSLSEFMPKKEFGEAPFPPVIRLDTSVPISIKQLSDILRARLDGVTICVRSVTGHENRGGYFFHLQPTDKTLTHCAIYNFEKIFVATHPLDKTVNFVNHCAGLAFDEWSYQFCQSFVNFRLDPE
jgi:hypothetical protein